MSVAATVLGGGSARRALGVAVLGFIGHLTFARIATLWEFPDDPVIALWPAVGIVIGIAMLAHTQWWWVLIGAWIAKTADLLVTASDLPVRTMIALLAAQVVEQTIATTVALSVIHPPEILRRATRTVPMVVGGAVMSAAIGAATLVAIGEFDDAWVSFRAWFIGDGVGIVIGAPTVYSLGQIRRVPRGVGAGIEVAVSIIVTCAITVWAFESSTPIVLLTIPAIGWLAVRFGIAASAPVALAVAMWGTWRTSDGSGPFTDLDNPVLIVQLFTVALALTAVIVGAESTELDRRRRRLEGLLASVPDAVIVVNTNGDIVEDFTSDAGAGRLFGQHLTDAVLDGFEGEVDVAMREWKTTGRSSMTVDRLSGTQRRPNTYETKFRQIAPDQAIAVARNVTDRAEERMEMQRQARRWRDLMKGSFQGVAEIDRDGVCIEANDRMAAIMGQPAMSLIGTHVNDLVTAELWSGWNDDIEQMRAGEQVTNELHIAGRIVTIVVMPHMSASGSFGGALVLALDTTPTIRRV